jgi:SNF2 family DNA or RNA helicase
LRATTVRPQAGSYTVGDWYWDTRHGSPCRVVDRQDIWGVIAYRVWLPASDALVRAGAADLVPLAAVRPSLKQILYTVAAGKLLDALEDKLLLAPLQSNQFLRLMQLIDRESFPDEGSVSRDRVRPFVIRTEKRNSIDAEGQPLFKPRVTRLQAVAWQDRHGAQQRLYEAVTDYVRHGYNQPLVAKQRHIGFLMILMQRLVASSTAAIRTTLEKRQALLNEPQPQASLFDSTEMDGWAELDGQSQVDIAVQTSGWAQRIDQERAEVDLLLNLARETEAQGTDAKAEALLELIYKLQQEENDPTMKVLIFTEFVPTQAMLASFLESRGFSVALLNGSMDLDTRAKTQQAFSRDVRILVSTDAGGEGLNLQFCHIIVNFDMPWNPMRIEQRIGRVDRIGQRHGVRAINLVLDGTVEHRVRQVLESKLEVIAQEFGVDKASDVMDSVEAEAMFDEVFVQGLQDPLQV